MKWQAPRFWWRQRSSLPALALAPVAALWSAVAGRRMRRAPSARASVPVICVGNFVVGGAGKTPTALALARICMGLGLAPGFLTRGYGGSAREPLMVDRKLHDAARVGDEALLLAEAGPVVVSPDRPAGLPLLQRAGVDIIIMDDGFQNPALAKDLALLVVDGATGIGNGWVMPSGPLRAPLRTQLARADALVIVGPGEPGDRMLRRGARAGRPVLRARLMPALQRDWGTEPYLAFAGIGRPEKFFNSLDRAGAPIGDVKAFPDHYVYTAEDARMLLGRAETEGLRLITTAKDFARLSRAEGEVARLRQWTEVFEVRMVFENEELLASLITAVMRRASPR
ncbi:tetraacyldisaccharide 4'-kinase [Kaistia dalseonensis]|uniref:Tetraacyldisaccharide 4'-kinase n=1 Tax=Kaistia dalseonensis TaxID=410840 RepID=A0ABU0HCG1_9HYPH|nr:tetraacyldisaccharide 4'-kinase [Kaistia dalseonensis]MCX5497366.1 tetraacyldisaccharide 4'-kinase [Kaistia dalseonensis]MDQ0440004.1 tetraacyldisaccharide 4'-kinase [Kaistia dalseonensis]